MTIKEKAKAYDEVLKNANEWLKSPDIQDEAKCVIEDIFPQLAESEDERIRKMMIQYFTDMKKYGYSSSPYSASIFDDDCIAYLEKQKE